MNAEKGIVESTENGWAWVLYYMNRLNMVPRKSLCIALALVLIQSLVWMPTARVHASCAGGCCVQCDMRGSQHAAETNGNSQPQGCCCGTKTTPCDVSQGCALELPDFAVFAVPMVEKPAPADIASTTTNLLPPLDLPRGFTNKVWTFSMGPPVPLFLLNLSLLC